MRAIQMDGRLVASGKMEVQKTLVMAIKGESGKDLKLACIQVGNNQASNCYISLKNKKVAESGIGFEHIALDEFITTETLVRTIKQLNEDETVTAILVQKPLPEHVDEKAVDDALSPEKDADGFNVINTGILHSNRENTLVPCTAVGVVELLGYYDIKPEGKNVLIMGRSTLVTNPLAKLLMDANATVTQVHSRTSFETVQNLVFNADIIISAMGTTKHKYMDIFRLIGSALDEGKSREIDRDYPVLIDCGTNRDENNKVVGDFPEEASLYTFMRTPATGGVGPMTVSCLIDNIIKCFYIQNPRRTEL